MTKNVFVSVTAALLLLTGAVWGATRGEGSAAGSPETVTVGRGNIALTVGGIGHVATLTDASRLAVASSGTSGPAASGSGASASAPVEAVFATVPGHVTSLLVDVGDEVTAGQPIAVLSDTGTTKGALIQARSDLASTRLELLQKRVQDPARGLPPTAAELAHGRRALVAAQDGLDRLTGRPLPSELAAARLDIAKAAAELETEQNSAVARPDALAAAEQAVASATQRLAVLSGSPDPADLAAARLEIARAQLEQETLLRPPARASATEIAAADAAINSARERLAAGQEAGVTSEIAAAQAELARTQADREALNQAAAPPSAAAQAAAQLAIDAAQRKLDQLLSPPAQAVSAARGELSKAQADLVAVRATGSATRTAAARSAVSSARSRLDLLLDPAPETVSSARAAVARMAADIAILRQRGAPASEVDLAIAGLRVEVARQQLRLAREMIGRLTVRAPAAGTVTSVLTATGAAVDATTPIVRVQDLDNLVVSMNLTEFDVSKTRVGAAARISADALGGTPYTGTVLDVALSGSDSGGVVTFPVTVSVKDAEGLRPGMSVSVRIVVSSREDVVRLPLDAIEDRAGRQATITVRTKAKSSKERKVMLGLVGATYAEVRSGLAAGERVVIANTAT